MPSKIPRVYWHDKGLEKDCWFCNRDNVEIPKGAKKMAMLNKKMAMLNKIIGLFRRLRKEEQTLTVIEYDFSTIIIHDDGMTIPCDLSGPDRHLPGLGWKVKSRKKNSEDRNVTIWCKE